MKKRVVPVRGGLVARFIVVVALSVSPVPNDALAESGRVLEIPKAEADLISVKGLDADIRLAPGQTLAQAKDQIAASNQRVLELLRNPDKAEAAWVAHWKDVSSGKRFSGMSGGGEGGNAFNGATRHGNILIGRYDCLWSTLDYCHAGIWDHNRRQIRSSNSGGGPDYDGDQTSGTDWEPVDYWRDHNDEVVELTVRGTTDAQGASAVQTSHAYRGGYSINTAKRDNNLWYCSKVVYRAFLDATGKVLDWGGAFTYRVTPWDVYADGDTRVVVWYY